MLCSADSSRARFNNFRIARHDIDVWNSREKEKKKKEKRKKGRRRKGDEANFTADFKHRLLLVGWRGEGVGMSEARWRHVCRELDGFTMRCYYYEMVSTCSIMLF